MLKFQTPPDKIFMAILTGSMEMMIDQIREILAVHRKKEVGAGPLESVMPNAARVFVPETALKTLKNMLHCHAGPGLYRLNAYQNLLLHDTLGYFCNAHNGRVASARSENEKQRVSRVGAFHIERIGFDDLIDIYFYNTHFFLDEDTVMNLDVEERKELGIHDEVFSLVQGLAPHPEELIFRKETDEHPVLRMESQFWRPLSRKYPDFER
jgi:hypothetical protein